VCFSMCCRWPEEPAASGCVRKHLIRDAVEKEREKEKKKTDKGKQMGRSRVK